MLKFNNFSSESLCQKIWRRKRREKLAATTTTTTTTNQRVWRSYRSHWGYIEREILIGNFRSNEHLYKRFINSRRPDCSFLFVHSLAHSLVRSHSDRASAICAEPCLCVANIWSIFTSMNAGCGLAKLEIRSGTNSVQLIGLWHDFRLYERWMLLVWLTGVRCDACARKHSAWICLFVWCAMLCVRLTRSFTMCHMGFSSSSALYSVMRNLHK